MYNISINVSRVEIDGPAWRDYGMLTASGSSLAQLLKNAEVEVVDFAGQVMYRERAASEWMQDLVRQEFYAKYGKSGSGNGDSYGGFSAFLALCTIICVTAGCSNSKENLRLQGIEKQQESLAYEIESLRYQVSVLKSEIDVAQASAADLDSEFQQVWQCKAVRKACGL